MYSVQLGRLVLEFERALIHVPQNAGGLDYDSGDWKDEWIDREQQIEVHQRRHHAMVMGLNGFGKQRGEHRVEVVEPGMTDLHATCDYLVAQAAISPTENELVRAAVEVTVFPCGQVLSLNWSALGYAPGGRQYCLLPHGLPAISTGFLRLDWKSVAVRRL